MCWNENVGAAKENAGAAMGIGNSGGVAYAWENWKRNYESDCDKTEVVNNPYTFGFAATPKPPAQFASLQTVAS